MNEEVVKLSCLICSIFAILLAAALSQALAQDSQDLAKKSLTYNDSLPIFLPTKRESLSIARRRYRAGS